MYQGHLLVIDAAALRRFRRQAAGRPRERQQEWHRSSSDNAQVLTHISVAVRAGQGHDLEKRLEQIHQHNQHCQLPGTIARYIAIEPGQPLRITIVLIWRTAAMPSQEEMRTALNALWADLHDMLDRERATIQECEMLLHT